MRTDAHDLDDRIRTLLGRAVAESPQAPDATHVARRGAELAADPTHHRGRPTRTLVVGIAAAILLVVGLVVARHDAGDRTVVTNPGGDGSRFVLSQVPDGYRLAGWRDQAESFGTAVEDQRYAMRLPTVQVFERSADGVLVRLSRTPPMPGEQEDEGVDDETWLRDRMGYQLDDGTFTVFGSTAVRIGHLAVGATEARSTTFFLRHGGVLVEVDAYGAGLDDDEALAVLGRFVARGDGRFDPPVDGSFREVGEAEPHDTEQLDPSLTLAHWSGPNPGGLQVISRGLRVGEEEHVLLAKRDLGMGTVEQWGDREVLVIPYPETGTASASFIEGGRVVTVGGPQDLLVSLVAQTEAVDATGWQGLVADGTRRLRALPTVSSVDVGAARIEVHQAPGSTFPAGWCLTVDGATACAADERTWYGFGPDDADPGAAAAFDVLVAGQWWVFGRGGTEEAGDGAAADPLTIGGRVDEGRWDPPTQVGVDGVRWWAGPVADEATALFVDVEEADGSGIGRPAARPAS